MCKVEVFTSKLRQVLSFSYNHLLSVVYKIDPLLKMIKLRNKQTVPKITIPKTVFQPSDYVPEKCVSLNILAQPESGPIRADVIFIHGLHGKTISSTL